MKGKACSNSGNSAHRAQTASDGVSGDLRFARAEKSHGVLKVGHHPLPVVPPAPQRVLISESLGTVVGGLYVVVLVLPLDPRGIEELIVGSVVLIVLQ